MCVCVCVCVVRSVAPLFHPKQFILYSSENKRFCEKVHSVHRLVPRPSLNVSCKKKIGKAWVDMVMQLDAVQDALSRVGAI